MFPAKKKILEEFQDDNCQQQSKVQFKLDNIKEKQTQNNNPVNKKLKQYIVKEKQNFDSYLLQKYMNSQSVQPDPFFLIKKNTKGTEEDEDLKQFFKDFSNLELSNKLQNQKISETTNPNLSQNQNVENLIKQKNQFFKNKKSYQRKSTRQKLTYLSHQPYLRVQSQQSNNQLLLNIFKQPQYQQNENVPIPLNQNNKSKILKQGRSQSNMEQFINYSIVSKSYWKFNEQQNSHKQINNQSLFANEQKSLNQSESTLLVSHPSNNKINLSINVLYDSRNPEINKSNQNYQKKHVSMFSTPLYRPHHIDLTHQFPNKQQSIPVLPKIDDKKIIETEKKISFKYRLKSAKKDLNFFVVRNKVEPYVSPEISSEDEFQQKGIPSQQLQTTSKNNNKINNQLQIQSQSKQLNQQIDAANPANNKKEKEKTLLEEFDDINYELYKIKKQKQIHALNKSNVENEEDAFIEPDKKMGMESEIEILMDIFTPKINKDKKLIEELKKYYYQPSQFLHIFEQYVQYCLDNGKVNLNTTLFNYYKIPFKLLQDLVDFFDVALKRKYNYSQFVTNDYLNSFNRQKLLITFSTIQDELGGENITKIIINDFFQLYYSQSRINAVFIDSDKEQYKLTLIKILVFTFIEKKVIFYQHDKDSIALLHKNLKFTTTDFFIFKNCFWIILTQHEINPTTKLNIMTILEEMRSSMCCDIKRALELQDKDTMLSLYDTFEWKVSLDSKIIENFVKVSNIIFIIFLKGVFFWVIFEDKNTYDISHYIDNKIIEIPLDVFQRIQKVIILSLLEYKFPTFFIRQVQIKCEKFIEQFEIRDSRLIQLIGPDQIPILYKDLVSSILKQIQFFKEKLKENNLYDDKDFEKLYKRLQKNDDEDRDWFVHIVICFFSHLNCYSSQDIAAICKIYKIKKSHLEVIKQALLRQFQYFYPQNLFYIAESLQVELDYHILNTNYV